MYFDHANNQNALLNTAGYIINFFRLYLIMPFQSDEKTCLAEILGQNSSSDSVLAYVVDQTFM